MAHVVRVIFAVLFVLIGFSGVLIAPSDFTALIVCLLAVGGFFLIDIADSAGYLARRERQRQAVEDQQRAAESEPARQAAAQARQIARNHHREMRQGRRRQRWDGVDRWLIETMGEDGPAVTFLSVLFRIIVWGTPIAVVLLVALGTVTYFYR